MFQPDFDWDAEFLKKDLLLIGIKEPSPELIEKIKALFHGHEKIRPGILIIKKERLAHSEDPAIQDLYKKIEDFIALKKNKHEKQQAKRSDAVVKIQTPMTIFTPEEDGYGKITFGTDNRLSFQKYKVQEDGTFAPEAEENQDTDLIFQNGQWVTDEDDSVQYTLDSDGAISLPKWNEKAYLVAPKDPIAGKSKKFPQYHTAVTMPDDAKMYFIKIKKMKDTYMLNQEVQQYQQNSDRVPYTSISDFIEAQCETRWFEGDENGGLAFAGEKTEAGYSCDGTQTKGKLVYAKNTNNGTEIVNEDAGTWEVKTLEGDTKVLVVKPYNMKRFHDDEGDISYPIFAVNQGILYRGDLEPAGMTRAIPAFNKSAMNAITETISANWTNIIKEMPVNDFKKHYNQ
ncbi:MAG: hypothetical protein DSZ05_02130 [Sulfurospirillum sp.]|nr:MAG: hypothetical protein DSZ05_02130 [Sulfurospirillum sp.]